MRSPPCLAGYARHGRVFFSFSRRILSDKPPLMGGRRLTVEPANTGPIQRLAELYHDLGKDAPSYDVFLEEGAWPPLPSTERWPCRTKTEIAAGGRPLRLPGALFG